MTTTDDGSSSYSSIGDVSSLSGGGASLFSMGQDGSEAEVINHLLEVEKEAEAMIAEADAEATRRTGEYKAKAEAQFKEAHDALVAQMDASYKEQIDAIQKEHDDQIAAYKQGIESITPDRAAFNALVEKALASA